MQLLIEATSFDELKTKIIDLASQFGSIDARSQISNIMLQASAEHGQPVEVTAENVTQIITKAKRGRPAKAKEAPAAEAAPEAAPEVVVEAPIEEEEALQADTGKEPTIEDVRTALNNVVQRIGLPEAKAWLNSLGYANTTQIVAKGKSLEFIEQCRAKRS